MGEKIPRQFSGGYFPGGNFIEPSTAVQVFQQSQNTFNVASTESSS